MKKNMLAKVLIVWLIPAALVLSAAAVSSAATAQGVMNVTATVVTGAKKCTFTINPLNFPVLNPLNPVDVFATADVTVDCQKDPTTFDISADGGAHYLGGNRMQNIGTPSEHIRYSLTGASGTVVNKSVPVTVQITGTILGSDYATAYYGNYSDVVTLTLTY